MIGRTRALLRACLTFSFGFVFRLAPVVAIAAASLAVAFPAQARSFRTIYSFPAATGTNIYGPQSGLVVDQKTGVVYGAASNGGTGAGGAIFSLTPPVAPATRWTLTKLHQFGNATNDGKSPEGRILGLNGALYGTTVFGPSLVYRLTPGPANKPWNEALLHIYQCCTDVVTPYDGVFYDAKGWAGTRGAFYGVTSRGGASNLCFQGCGAVYMLKYASKVWTLTAIHSFTGTTHGWNPTYGVEMDSKGVLYGQASNGGAHDTGLIYSLAPPVAPKTTWTYTVLHSFSQSNGEGYPISPLLLYNGALYGSSSIGVVGGPGGTIYKLTPPVAPKKVWTKSNLLTFNGSNGAVPNGKLLVDKSGAFWGTTFAGGAKNCGTVYKLSPPAGTKKTWTYTLIHSFNDRPDGCGPSNYGLVTDASGAIYGATGSGGANGSGSIFRIVP
ncbi:MAG TPA: choice-of-anchor tandem repeat GloVer-containing protein [Pseudolabrys sp.]|nr:choice-of-anchor tandem repeat GloVer-containing protein [Pseudolabrys sp.]